MARPFFFGYGSLVNRRTHDYPSFGSARLKGWRREWQPSPIRSVAFLNIVRDDDCAIDGAVAEVPGGDWAALDHRERAYVRQRDESSAVSHANSGDDVHFYSVENPIPLTPTHPILLSYLDVVVQGFLLEYGRDGVDRFFATTTGWHGIIRNDRDAPLYPRHQALNQDERVLVDEKLAELSAVVE